MHLNSYANRHQLLLDWVTSAQKPGERLLDIGASDGSFCPEVSQLVDAGFQLAGVDPDESRLAHNPWVQQRFPERIEEAAIPEGSFDAAFALYVLEHVEDPEAFLGAVYRALRPGGSFFFITPNGRHYFAILSRLLGRLGAQERALRILRPSDLVERYHHHALYRMNTPRVLTRLASEAGFSQVELRYSERLDEIACYFPRRARLIPRLLQSAVTSLGREDLLLNLMGRLIK